MPQRKSPFYATIVKPFGRRLSSPVDRGWGDTFIGPLDTPREADPVSPANPGATETDVPHDDPQRPMKKGTGHN
jgi:hypothetical protein